ncbi:MAG: ABC transporter permease [Nitrospinota bacterium]
MSDNKARSLFTLLGVIIGVASVIMIGAASKSGKDLVFSELQTFGLKSVWVFRTAPGNHPGKTFRKGTGILNDDVVFLQKKATYSELIEPVSQKWGLWAKYLNKFLKIHLLGVSSGYLRVSNDQITEGRGFTREDLEWRRPVCIIGTKVQRTLFGENGKALEKEIFIEKEKYTVVGILKRKDRDFLASIGSAGGQDANDRVLIPLSLFQKQKNTKEVGHLHLESKNAGSSKAAGNEVVRLLRARHNNAYHYRFETMSQYVKTANTIISIVSWIGGLAAMVSLLVGGIGIMNIMTASVVERTREIGIRKALGASGRDIVFQFLVESSTLSFIGGAIGVITGVAGIFLIQALSD